MLKLTRRGSKGIYYITGSIGGSRYRESTGTDSKDHAQVILSKRQSEILDRVTWGEKYTSIFSEAVILYLENKKDTIGEYDVRFVSKLNERFGHSRMSQITQLEVTTWAANTYPKAGAHGLDRQVFTPLIAIYHMAHEAQMCDAPHFKRPEKPKKKKKLVFATDAAIVKLLPHCIERGRPNERLKAVILLMSFSGARASEACRLEDEDIDWKAHKATLAETKNGDPRVITLPRIVLEALSKLRGAKGPIFGYASRFSLNQAIKRACKKAGLKRMTSHQVGRHSFAARLLGQGYTLKQVQEAGGWKSYKMVADTYGHLEKSHVESAVRNSDTNLAQLIGDGQNVVRIQNARKA